MTVAVSARQELERRVTSVLESLATDRSNALEVARLLLLQAVDDYVRAVTTGTNGGTL